MSSMLERAIIDAEELRKAAHKNAEEAVIEKYQSDIREAVEKILEQEDFDAEPALGGGEDTALGVSDEGELTFVLLTLTRKRPSLLI